MFKVESVGMDPSPEEVHGADTPLIGKQMEG